MMLIVSHPSPLASWYQFYCLVNRHTRELAACLELLVYDDDGESDGRDNDDDNDDDDDDEDGDDDDDDNGYDADDGGNGY